jgi:hypothetical protein
MKKIVLDDKFKQDIINKFINYVNTTKFTDNHINFSTDITNVIDKTQITRPTVYISAVAYLKMLLYVQETTIEIAWHGTVERNQEHNWYHIKDVFLYPQTITACTVNTDQKEYQEWLQNIEDDEIFNNIRFQGHSHVNMGTSPSGTDLNMYHNFLQVLPKNDYYIFMIMNKSKSITCFIYDLAKNLIYETQDIDIKILTNNSQDLIKDLKEEKEKYCKNVTTQYADYDPFARNIPNSPYNTHSYAQSANAYMREITKQYGNTVHNDYTETDKLFDELDQKYKNPVITSKRLKKQKRK